jgi:hypothetical protein
VKKSKFIEGPKARRSFERTMKELFSVPKAKVDSRKPVRKRASGTTALQNSKHYRFIVRPTLHDFSSVDIAVHVARFATDKSFVHLDFLSLSTELDHRVGLHCKTDAMHHEPCGLLCDSQSATNLVGTYPVLAVCNHPDGDHPLVHSDGRILKDCPDFDGELLFTSFAEPDSSCRNERVFVRVTSGARNSAFRPAQRDRVAVRPLRVRKVHDCLLQRFGELQVWAHCLVPFYA